MDVLSTATEKPARLGLSAVVSAVRSACYRFYYTSFEVISKSFCFISEFIAEAFRQVEGKSRRRLSMARLNDFGYFIRTSKNVRMEEREPSNQFRRI